MTVTAMSSPIALLVVLLFSVLSFQDGSGETLPHQIKPRSSINCTVAGMRYPLYTGCQGSLQCGRNNLAYRQNCPADRCYDYLSNRCNRTVDSPNGWFDCSPTNHGRMVPYPQNPSIYGLCLNTGLAGGQPAVIFLNHCSNNRNYNLATQSCQ